MEEPLVPGNLTPFLLLETLVLRTLPHWVFRDSPLDYQFGCSPLRWSRILPMFQLHLILWMSIHHPHINLMSTFCLLHPSSLLPFLLLRLVKALKQVARLIRRRRNRKRRRRRARKGPRPQQHQMLALSNQLLLIVLGVLMISIRLKGRIQNPNSLAAFVRVTTFYGIAPVLPRS